MQKLVTAVLEEDMAHLDLHFSICKQVLKCVLVCLWFTDS